MPDLGKLSNVTITSGAVYPFVAQWLTLLRIQAVSVYKDWAFLEALPKEVLAQHREGNTNVISFNNANRKLSISTEHSNVYHAVTKQVKFFCIDHMLTLPGFYAFLKELTAIQQKHQSVFNQDNRLQEGCNELIEGYWNAVKPGLHDVAFGQTYDQSQALSEQVTAIQQLDSLIQQHEVKEAKSEKSLDLDPQLPFRAMKKIKADLQQTLGLGSKPTPTLTR
ncbi:MAG: hypothetical protein A3F17_08565 [Gammaproteobacteria bacterium RIFCSPHIGHO2_12_FULL_41_15]|nr:MAG: hypothetical protein A3F17_08565 [Gammaproteobacteria bacterium RIFCSPHIGHO2_12_FULL_41_15]